MEAHKDTRVRPHVRKAVETYVESEATDLKSHGLSPDLVSDEEFGTALRQVQALEEARELFEKVTAALKGDYNEEDLEEFASVLSGAILVHEEVFDSDLRAAVDALLAIPELAATLAKLTDADPQESDRSGLGRSWF